MYFCFNKQISHNPYITVGGVGPNFILSNKEGKAASVHTTRAYRGMNVSLHF